MAARRPSATEGAGTAGSVSGAAVGSTLPGRASKVSMSSSTLGGEGSPAPWVDDASASACMRCRAKFKYPLRRRHHCRKCGDVVCSTCSKSRQIVQEYHATKEQRVCYSCAETPSSTSGAAPADGAPAAAASARGNTKSRSNRPLSMEELGGTPVASDDPPWRELGTLRVTVVEGKGLLAADVSLISSKKTSDPYCVLRLDDGPLVRTRTISATLEPRWNTTALFKLSRCNSVLVINVWDEDALNADDPLGCVRLPLDLLHETPAALRGWFPLTPPDGLEGKAAGAILLELQLVDFRASKHFLAHVAPLPPPPQPLPPFDVDAVYGPLMKLVDLLWTRLFSHVVLFLLNLIFWKEPRKSALALVLWNVGACWFLPHWPAAALVGLALYALSFRQEVMAQRHCQLQRARTAMLERQASRSLAAGASSAAGSGEAGSADAGAPAPTGPRNLLRQLTAPAAMLFNANHPEPCPPVPEGEENEAEVAAAQAALPAATECEEAQLGAAVHRLCFVLPSWVKELCRGFQPLLRTVADGAQLVHDLMTWRHPHSLALVVVLLVTALIVEVLQRSTTVMLLGTAVLLACSPLVPAITGLVSYVGWARGGHGVPEDWTMKAEYQAQWSSKDYRPSAPAVSEEPGHDKLLKARTFTSAFTSRSRQSQST